MANSCPWAYLSNSNLQFTNYFLTNETQHRKAIKYEKRLKDKCLLIAIKLSTLLSNFHTLYCSLYYSYCSELVLFDCTRLHYITFDCTLF